MNVILKYGIVLGILVEIWTAIVIGMGWHKDPALLLLFFVVIPIEITVLVMALKSTAAGAAYGKQFLTGFGIALVGGVLVALGSIVLTTVVFPNYFAEIRAAGEAMLQKAGLPAEQIEAQLKANEGMYNPWQNALSGFLGTSITGLVVSAIAGAFLRKR
ncbi:MAG TPA: DUF4199 domain-containing protein [Candidatus Eisenbacteria bacterium]|jgi:hypothetical protein|nr:DUF4199 domain-containing protein [Candidatus Eisenbacteria bacterium]